MLPGLTEVNTDTTDHNSPYRSEAYHRGLQITVLSPQFEFEL